jgi:hypothetical protein
MLLTRGVSLEALVLVVSLIVYCSHLISSWILRDDVGNFGNISLGGKPLLCGSVGRSLFLTFL